MLVCVEDRVVPIVETSFSSVSLVRLRLIGWLDRFTGAGKDREDEVQDGEVSSVTQLLLGAVDQTEDVEGGR